LANTGGTGFLAQAVPEIEFLRQLVAGIPQGHHVELLKKVKVPAARQLSDAVRRALPAPKKDH
jgi:hypothetical protein